MLSYTRYPDLDFTYFVSDGETAVEDWLDTVRNYRLEGLTNRELYDLRKHQTLYSNEEIGKILEAAKKNRAMHTTNRRTAIVVENQLQFGLSRMYELKSEVEGVLTRAQAFYNVDEAIAWLGEDIINSISKLRS